MRAYAAAVGIVLAAAAFPATALAHGGTYQGPGSSRGPGFQVPPDVAVRDVRRTSWERWWASHKDRHLNLEERLQRHHGAVTGDGPTLEDIRKRRTAVVRETLVPLFIEALEHSDAEIRASAAIALGKSRDPRGAKPLRKAAQADPDDDVRHAAVMGLGLSGHEDNLPLLDGILNDVRENERRRAFAAFSLGLLRGDDAASALVRFATERIKLWIRSRKPKQRLLACTYLALGLSDSEQGLGVLRDAFADRKLQPDMRAYAMLSVGRLQDRESLDGMIAVLGDRDAHPIMRRAAAVSLGRIATAADWKAVSALTTAAQEETDVEAKDHAILALGGLRGMATQNRLQTMFADAPERDRPTLALALALQKDPRAIPPLREALKKGATPQLRAAYCLALGLLGDLDSVKLIEAELVADTGVRQRSLAALALGLMDSQGSRDLVHRQMTETDQPLLRVNLAVASTLLGDRRATKFLVDTMNEKTSVRDRAGAAVTLGVIRGFDAVPPMVDLYRDKRVEPVIRAFAIVGLGFMADPEPVPRLARLAVGNDPTLTLEPLRDVLSIL